MNLVVPVACLFAAPMNYYVSYRPRTPNTISA